MIRRNDRSQASSSSWRKALFGFLACLVSLAFMGLDAPAARARPQAAVSGNAYDLIAAVNQLRTSNGLPAYQINAALMAAAQAHSDYQASIGSVTHTGRGGTSAKDRAIAAGYGGGAEVYVSENVAGGMSVTSQSAVQMWQGDSLHLNAMLGANYQDAGAGVATAGEMTFFTLDVGYVGGTSDSESSGDGTQGSGASAAPANPPTLSTAVAFFPVLTATPGPDGSIVHEVRSGQSLWSIAATYKVELPDLLALNGFTGNTLIFPGDKVVIKPADIAPDAASPVPETAQAMEPLADTSAPLATTAVADRSETGVDTLTPTPGLTRNSGTHSNTDPLLWIIAALVLGGTALIVVGNVLKRGD